MKLITSTTELTNEFRRLLKSYKSFSWLIAWAGKPFELTDLLEKYSKSANKVVIGLHFYQTHPDFIQRFMGNEHFRFIKQTQGTYHSKIYYFENAENDWELLIGSSNFTNAAFSCNTETNVLITSKSQESVAIRNKIFTQIDSSWNIAKE